MSEEQIKGAATVKTKYWHKVVSPRLKPNWSVQTLRNSRSSVLRLGLFQ